MKNRFPIQNKKIIFILSFIILFVCLLWTMLIIFSQSNRLNKFDSKKYEKKYYESQWAVPNSQKPISDETLYTYAGYKYITGTNPILVNPEAPPLGKYLIGLSIIFFNNQSVINIIIGIACLALVYHIIYLITSSFFYSSLGVFFTSINTLFTDQLIHTPQLEIFQLFFLLLITICLMQYQKKKYTLLLLFVGILLGCFFSIKAFILHLLLATIWLCLYFISLNKAINKKVILSIGFVFSIAFIIFTTSYFNYFLQNGTLRGFLGVQKWITLFYHDSKINIFKILGSYIPLILFNKWRFWSEGYPLTSYSSWSILWPIIYIFGIYSTLMLKQNQLTRSLILFVGTYSLFLFFIPVFPRYLLLLFVPLTILSTVFLYTITHKYIYEKK